MPSSRTNRRPKIPLPPDERARLLSSLSTADRADLDRFEARLVTMEGTRAAAKGRPRTPRETAFYAKTRRRAVDHRLLWLVAGGQEQYLEPVDPTSPWCMPPWNVSELPTGEIVPDRLLSHSLRGRPYGVTGVWVHPGERSRASGHMDDAIAPVVASGFISLLGIAGLLAPTPWRGDGVLLAVGWPILPTLVYLFYRRRSRRRTREPPPANTGVGALTLDLDGSRRTSGESTARWAADDLGARVTRERPATFDKTVAGGSMGWDIDHGTTIMSGISAFMSSEALVISTEGIEHADFHRRHKGRILFLLQPSLDPSADPGAEVVALEALPASLHGVLEWKPLPQAEGAEKGGPRFRLDVPLGPEGAEPVVAVVKATVRHVYPRLGPAVRADEEVIALATGGGGAQLRGRVGKAGDKLILQVGGDETDVEMDRVRKAVATALSGGEARGVGN